MRRAHLAALGVALTLAAGTVPAAATPPAPDTTDALVKALAASPRSIEGTRTARAGALGLADTATGLPVDSYFRIDGDTRYETAVAVSFQMVCSPTTPTSACEGQIGGADAPVRTVFVANGQNFPDALGAGPVAAGLGPLLLVPPTGTVPAAVMDEIARIAPGEIVIFGGNGAVSASVEDQLKAHAPTLRIQGASRYETAADAALFNDENWRLQDEDGDAKPDRHGLDTVVLASGEGFADALSGGGAASNLRGSLMLTTKSSLPTATKAALQEIASLSASAGMSPPTVVILGGTGVITSSVEGQVKAALPTSTVVRVAGANRFETAIALSDFTFSLGAPEVFVVYAYNFPDALASAPLAGVAGASTLLADTSCVTANTRAEASRLNPTSVTGFGGAAVLADTALFLDAC